MVSAQFLEQARVNLNIRRCSKNYIKQITTKNKITSLRNPLSRASCVRGVCGDDGREFEFKPRWAIFADTGELGDDPVRFQLSRFVPPYGC